ncbi:MAG: hypothetical protein AAGJ83_10400 [Planctomycetota bacterium]
MLDRIDIHLEVPAVAFDELSGTTAAEGTTSEQMRDAVTRARSIQMSRFASNLSGVRYNAQMTSRQVREHCQLDGSCKKLLRHSVEEMGLSARAHDKILRVSRTIADVAGDQEIQEQHLSEAINYRTLDRELWV